MQKKSSILFAILAMASQFVGADPEDSWNMMAGTGILYDGNLFRLPNGKESSEQVTTLAAGLKVDKSYSLQRFVLDAVVTDYHYQKNSGFDYVGKNLNAAWKWSVTPYLHGNLSASRTESLSSFVDYTGLSPNLRTVENYRFDAEWEAFGPWRLIGGVSHQKVRNKQTFMADSDYDADIAEYGIKYQAASGNNVALLGRQLRGDYVKRGLDPVNLLDTGFDEQDIEVRGTWEVSGKSRLNGRLGYISRVHDNFAERDYNGMVGQIDYVWAIGGNLQLTLGAKQELNAYQTADTLFNSSYYRLRGFSIMPAWQVGSKVTLRLRYAQDYRAYRGGIIAGLPERDDILRSLSLSLDWMPLRTLQISTYIQQDRRSSDRPGNDFEANMAGMNANLTF